MKRTNRIEPLHTGKDDLKPTLMTITTQLEIIRRVEVVPITETSDRLHSDLNQLQTDHVQLRSRTRTDAAKRSRKTLGFIGCLFVTAGMLSILIVISGIIVAVRNSEKERNSVRENDIEKYDLGDLHYGINHENRVDLPSNTYLSSINKEAFQKYLSDQLLNVPGFRGLVIDGVFVQNQPTTSKRKQRETSCRVIFIIHNLQVYFDQCSACTNNRNRALYHSFFNRTTLRQPIYLLFEDQHIFAYICSTPTMSLLIAPERLNISHTQRIHDNPSQPLKMNTTAARRKKPLDIRTDTSTLPNKRLINLMQTTTTSSTTTTWSTILEADALQTSNIPLLSSMNRQTSDHMEETSQSTLDIRPSTKLRNHNHQQSSSPKSKTAIQRTTPSMFQFLPFKPSANTLARRNTSFHQRIPRHFDQTHVFDDFRHRRSSVHRT